MQKLLPLLQSIAVILAKLNPAPFLDSVEQEYGRTAKLVLIAVVVLVAVAVLGYNADSVLTWAGVTP